MVTTANTVANAKNQENTATQTVLKVGPNGFRQRLENDGKVEEWRIIKFEASETNRGSQKTNYF